ncbi:MAG: helix-turn-helix transcriptional regulator [Marinobacterium sp.]|nr:helix-turn-helix transcriptional regulator [Marinobacterium sp.]
MTLATPLQFPIATCIEAIGYERFYPRFFKLMAQLAQVRQYMVFEFPEPPGEGQQNARCRLAHNVDNPELGLQLASLYIDGNYQHDPVLKRLAEEALQRPAHPACELLLRKNLPPVYRRRFYNVPDLGGKFAIAARDEETDRLFYINLYRASDSHFSDDEVSRLEQHSALICALLLRHFREEGQGRAVQSHLLAAGLSEREAQVCELIAAGHTAKTLARKLNIGETSAITYRKRAYQKLGVSRKSDLLALLKHTGPA